MSSAQLESSAALRKKKNMKKSTQFTVMVIGQSGSGRSTFINTFCDKLIVNGGSVDEEDELQLRKSNVELEDAEGLKINLNIIDTPNFGNLIDNSKSINILKDYLKYQFDEILVEESRLRRNPRFNDGRVHVCLYMINSTSHGLNELDIEIISKLGDFVNILPCISKSDSLTIDELKSNKKLIMDDIKNFKLPIFDFNNEFFQLEDYDEDSVNLNNYLQLNLPFALMGSNETIVDPNTNEIKRIRQYPWGSIDVLNTDFSDLLTLKNTLLITHLNDFKDFTHEVLYENYRTKTLGQYDNENNRLSTAISEDQIPRVLSISQDYAMASQSRTSVSSVNALQKEDQIRLEEERLKAFEERVQRDLLLKRQEIEARERELEEIERRLKQQQLSSAGADDE